ncbi:hypothetical protein [Kitasatospora sp. NPDC093558]|uniref:hypothetical protein n=1 Tax=Kitasatospora sp. NPDC093558 TaxID=3155201 RepID=UPI00341A65FE
MAVFACAGCGAELTAPVSRVALPVQAHQSYGDRFLPPLMEPGTYAVDPEPYGPPWRYGDETGADEPAAPGVYAPVGAVSFGPAGHILLAPGNTRGTVVIPERCDGCCGSDGGLGPNLACAACGLPVATRIDDCYLWQAVWLAPDAVLRLPVDGPPLPATGWEWAGIPPIDPTGYWSPRWAAAVGIALAHVLAASAGARVAVPRGLLATAFGPTLDALLPPGPPVRTLALAGPGLPAPGADLVLVPRHPVTGEVWRPDGPAAAVPLDAEVWAHLAFPDGGARIPATGGLPAGVQRDDPLPPSPPAGFRPDRALFVHTLARLPAVREPWLRSVYDKARGRY